MRAIALLELDELFRTPPDLSRLLFRGRTENFDRCSLSPDLLVHPDIKPDISADINYSVHPIIALSLKAFHSIYVRTLNPTF